MSYREEASTTHQSRCGEELDRQSSHGYCSLVIILHKISLQLLVILNNKGGGGDSPLIHNDQMLKGYNEKSVRDEVKKTTNTAMKMISTQ